ncbi:reverse transcriptase domain-containing protein [Tanacetum coccineum]
MEIYMIQPWHRVTRQKITQSFERVSEITFPSLTTSSGTEGPLVIEAEIGGHMIHRMYVDGGSSTEVLYEHCFNQLRPEIKNQMVPATTSLTGFSGETIWPLGELRLLNGIIRRPRIREIQAVPSTAHRMLKFPVDGGVMTIHSTILIPAECVTVVTSSKEIPKEAGVCHENFKIAPHPDFPDQEVAIEGTLSAKGRTDLCSLLKKNLDIFAWQPSDMTGVPRLVAEHRLNIREGYSPVRQKKGARPRIVRNPSKQRPIRRIVTPLPEIDWKVESLCGYPFKCFLDAYKGYHQIQMAESDEEKTAFHTSHGVYCYTKSPFGLKNAGSTYQRLVDKAFDSQAGRNIEVYVDDLVIKSHTEAKMLRDIDETFLEGMFLGYMIMPEGIKSCPDKTEAALQLSSPRTIKEVQSLNGKLANAEQAFKQLKQYLSELPLLVAPKSKEELIIYLSASHRAINAVLMTERGTVQTPVYFIIADFLVEKPDESPSDTSVVKTPQGSWTLFTDGSSCVDGSGAGLILTSPEGTEWEYAMCIKNKKADALSKIASTSFAHLSKQVLVEILKEKSIQEKEVTTVVEEDGPTWMTPIIEYLKEGTLPDDKKEARKLRIKARQYELLEGIL